MSQLRNHVIILIGENHNRPEGRRLLLDLIDYCHEKRYPTQILIELEKEDYKKLNNTAKLNKDTIHDLVKIVLKCSSLKKPLEPIDIPLPLACEFWKRNPSNIASRRPSSGMYGVTHANKKMTLTKALKGTRISAIPKLAEQLSNQHIIFLYNDEHFRRVREEYMSIRISVNICNKNKNMVSLVLIGDTHLQGLHKQLGKRIFNQTPIYHLVSPEMLLSKNCGKDSCLKIIRANSIEERLALLY